MIETTAGLCPFCGGDKCGHFVGWTDDGKTIQDCGGGVAVRAADRIVTTGVSARVYRLAPEKGD